MLEQFRHRIDTFLPQLRDGTTLLAVSGGVDSVVMTRLFAMSGLPFAIAHCNFQLRGTVSDGDEVFVRTLAETLAVSYHTVTFATEQLAAEKGVSIQMVARDLRYDWLEEIRQSNGYQYIATAHHLNDAIETSLLNQIRGTGIRGLTGIDLLHSHLVRPLLFFTRGEIEHFLQHNKWEIREDSSNSKDEYYRNRLRHHVVPIMQQINPSLERTYATNFRIWSETNQLMDWAVGQLRQQYVSPWKDGYRIDYAFLSDHRSVALTLLYEWLIDFGFHPDQLQQALDSAEKAGGAAVWQSATHRLLADRAAFYIQPIPPREEPATFELPQGKSSIQLPNGRLSGCLTAVDHTAILESSPWKASLDAAQLVFPLRIRRWQTGDVFCPLGMHGHRKKLQDFFTDQKLNLFEKEQVWLLVNGDGRIAWVVGYRLDDRFKVSEDTTDILRLRFDTE